MKSYLTQFISMILMVTLGVGIFVGFNMEWVSIEHNMYSFFAESGFADYRLVSEKGFSEEDLISIKNIAGVDEVTRYISVVTEVEDGNGDSLALCVTTNDKVSSFVLISGESYSKEDENGVWLSDRYARENGVSEGDEITLCYKHLKLTGKVKGLIKAAEQMICVRDETQLMPDFSTYGFAYISPTFYESAMGFVYYPQINLISSLTKKEITDKVNDALGQTTILLTKDETISYAEAEGEANEGKTMGSILPVLFLAIGLLTMITTMHRLTAKEKTQIGTLKALGFHDKKIALHYTSYAFFIALIGCVLGVGLGYLLAWLVMNPNGMMGTYLDLPRWELVFPWFCYVVLGVIVLGLTLVGYLSVKEMLKGTASDSLRPYTPKKVKPLAIEKTKVFHKLPFGTRWNMRDLFRHKARTAMSILGVLGCAVLIVASLGMRDSMNGFMSMYYDNGLNYSSRIFLTEEATAEERVAIIEKYDGDSSASINVQWEDKTISLDVYDIQNDKVRFSDESAQMITIEDNGAYLCMRLKNEFGVQVGDSVSLSPFGSDKIYTFEVAGFFRSVTENIVVSSAYAEACNVEYTVDSVYTDVSKENIVLQNGIKSVQSKQMIVDSFETFTSIMDLMVWLLVVAALILGVIVLYNLGTMSYTERYREMATLKVLGFRDKKIGKLLIGQNLSTTVFGLLVGIPLGYVTLDYLNKALAAEYEMMTKIQPLSYIVCIVLTLGMSLLVSLLVARKNKKIDMVEALKATE